MAYKPKEVVQLPNSIQPVIVTNRGPSRLRLRLLKGQLNIRRLMRLRPFLVPTLIGVPKDHFKRALTHRSIAKRPGLRGRVTWPKPSSCVRAASHNLGVRVLFDNSSEPLPSALTMHMT